MAAGEEGISFFIGEAEDGRLDEILIDAYAGRLKPMYDYRDKMPNLEGAPVPFLAREQVDRTYGSYSSFDLGRGCPFQCSFCTIINVQGRVSRYRSADRGYNSRYGSKDQYKLVYRDGFEAGYAQGYGRRPYR